MKLLTFTLILGLTGTLLADEEPKPDQPEKTVGEGAFGIKITFEGEEEVFDTPAKANASLRKARTKTRRLKEDDPTNFVAEITINGSTYEFTQPEDAQAVCKAVTDAQTALRKAKLQLGELGDFATLPTPVAGQNNKPNQQQVQAQIQAEVNRQVQQRTLQGGRPLNNQEIQQIQQQVYQQAQQQGLVPPGGFKQLDPKEALIESLRAPIEAALSKGQLGGNFTPAEPEKPAE